MKFFSMCECDLSPRNVKRLSWVIVSLSQIVSASVILPMEEGLRCLQVPFGNIGYCYLSNTHTSFVHKTLLLVWCFFQVSSATYLEIKHAPFCHKGNVNSKSASEREFQTQRSSGSQFCLELMSRVRTDVRQFCSPNPRSHIRSCFA